MPSTQTPTWRSECSATLRMGLPLIVCNLAQVGLGTVDLMLIGQLGAQALAAGALAGALYQTMCILCVGLISACLPQLAAIAARGTHKIRSTQALICHSIGCVLLACACMWPVLWYCQDILVAIGQPADVAKQASVLMHTLQWGTLPYLVFWVLRGWLTTLNLHAWAMWIIISALGINALAGWCLIFGHWGLPALGLTGAGLASTLANAWMGLVMLILCTRHRKTKRYALLGALRQTTWAQSGKAIWMLWKQGLPIALIFTFETSIFYGAIIMMGHFGSIAIGAHGIAIQLATLTFMLPYSLGQVATLRIAHAAANHPINSPMVTRAGWSAYGLGIGVMVLMAACMLLMPSTLAALFLDPKLPQATEVWRMASHLMLFAACFQVLDGAQAVSAAMLRGLQDTKVPMLLAIAGYWLMGLAPGAYWAYALDMQGTGVWLGLISGLGATAVMLTARWVWLTRIST